MNRSDLKDFDTTNAREPSEREIKSELRRTMGVGYVESEPERFMHPNHETRKLLEEHKAEIGDYASFKEVLNRVWGKDHSLKDLVKSMTEADYEALFNTSTVKEWVDGNTAEITIQGLMQRFNIERKKAETVYEKLNVDNRRKILTSLMRGRKITIRPEATQTPAPTTPRFQPPTVTQRSRWGTSYSRAKPLKWQGIQTEFIRNNQALPAKALHALYNQTFSQPRSIIAVRNKRRRMAL
jgi:hypothetical protein